MSCVGTSKAAEITGKRDVYAAILIIMIVNLREIVITINLCMRIGSAWRLEVCWLGV